MGPIDAITVAGITPFNEGGYKQIGGIPSGVIYGNCNRLFDTVDIIPLERPQDDHETDAENSFQIQKNTSKKTERVTKKGDVIKKERETTTKAAGWASSDLSDTFGEKREETLKAKKEIVDDDGDLQAQVMTQQTNTTATFRKGDQDGFTLNCTTSSYDNDARATHHLEIQELKVGEGNPENLKRLEDSLIGGLPGEDLTTQ